MQTEAIKALARTIAIVMPDQSEELRACYQRIAQLESTLTDARLQIEYLHDKFQPTGTGEATLARIDDVLDQFPGVA